MKYLDKLIGMLVLGLARLITGVNSYWVDCSPNEKQRVYFANHTSHLDAVVLWSSLPPRVREVTRPVAAKDYWESNFIRRYIAKHVFNVILVDRIVAGTSIKKNPLQGVDVMSKALEDGFSIMIFPEGTRGDGEKIKRFKGGLFLLAERFPQIEFVPVFLSNMNRILPKGEFLPVPMIGKVFFGEPMKHAFEEEKKDFLDRSEARLKTLMENFK